MQCYHYFKGSLYTFEGLLIVSGTFTETCFSFFFFLRKYAHISGESLLSWSIILIIVLEGVKLMS